MQRVSLRNLISVISFDQPLCTNYITAQFSIQHQQHLQQAPDWPSQSTRRIIVSQYWFRQVLYNFGLILTVGLLIALPYYSTWQEFLPSIFFAGIISFLTLTGFIYFPAFYGDFLPKLDAVIAEREKLTNQPQSTKKCKRTQFSIPTQTIIFYVFCTAGKISTPAANDKSAELLNKLFGTTSDSLKENLSRLYRTSQLSPKERAEILKGIEAAKSFFEALDSPPALQILDQLELKLQRT